MQVDDKKINNDNKNDSNIHRDVRHYDYLSPFLNGPNAAFNRSRIEGYETRYKSFFWMNECLLLCQDIDKISNISEIAFDFADQTFATVKYLFI